MAIRLSDARGVDYWIIEDWKSYEGWTQLAKQTGEEGSIRGLCSAISANA